MSSDEEPLVEDLNTAEVQENIEDIEETGENNTEEVTADQEQEDVDKKTVKPKRVIRNPQPKLNEQTIKGQKGLTALQGYFEKAKFKGKGHEIEDLNVLMKTYEYWCHRMFPKYPFDASIARLEVVGMKRAAQTYLKRIRMDLIFEEDKPVENEFEDVPTEGFVDPVEPSESQFDQLVASSSSSTVVPEIQITEDQLERIRQNKERAQALREERMRRIREKAAGNLEASSYLNGPTTSGSQDGSEMEASQNNENPRVSRPALSDDEEELDTLLDRVNDDETRDQSSKSDVAAKLDRIQEVDSSKDASNSESEDEIGTVSKKTQQILDDEDDFPDPMEL